MMRKGNNMTTTANMTDADLTQYLVDSSGVQDLGNAKMAYAAGYFESTILSLMARFPEVRKEIEDRVNFRMNQIEVDEYNARAEDRRQKFENGEYA
jgi:hypothetical protein